MRNSNKVAFNTSVNYIQLILNIVINLVTVRIILQSLGEIDYGIYSLIAGIIALITFIAESLSQTSVRFLSVSLGENRASRVKKVFASCYSLHLYIGIILAAVIEFLGLFIFDGYLNIPQDRIDASIVVFHCMVLSLFVNVIVTPFRALIIAHEQFVYIAIAGIVETLLKLLVALVVLYTYQDRLVVYGVLMAAITLVPFIIIIAISYYNYKKYIYLKLQGFGSLFEIAHFAGWTLLDVFGAVANRQGYAIMLNKFFGPSTNTVFALASHVESPLFLMSASAINTIKPQILKSYGAGDNNRMMRLSMTSGKLGFTLVSLLAIPFLVMISDILKIWLGDFPSDTVFFSRMMIIACLASQLTIGITTANQAVGKIKWFSIVVSCVRMSALPISIIVLLMGLGAEMAMVVYMLCESSASLCRIIIMHKIANLNIKLFITSVIYHVLPPFVLAMTICMVLYSLWGGLLGVIMNTILTIFVYVICIYLFGLTKDEKESIKIVLLSLRKYLTK